MRTLVALCFALLGGISAVQADPITVGNFVWEDADSDGIQDAAEEGLSGVTVQLWNSAKTQLLDSATTSASGTYSLTATGPGNYRVRVVLPAGATGFSPKDQGASDQLDSDVNPTGVDLGFTDVYVFPTSLISITTIDTGIVLPNPINVGNFVWNDVDDDGVQDAGEPGIPGATVQLWNSAKTQLLDSATTSASGTYSLTAPGAGNYRVRVLLPTGATGFSPKDQGASDQLDSDVNPTGTDLGFTDVYVFGSSLISITTIDTGIDLPTPITVGNFVWDDIDRDGVQDAGEPGVQGIIVQLWNSAKTQILDSDTTNASGLYSLTAPGPDNYRVRVVLPSMEFAYSPKDQGSNDQIDSDVNPTGINLAFTDVYVFPSNLISITTIDTGLLGPQVFADGFE
jgi:hypothetical protein